MSKILIVKTSAIGDVVQALPLLSYIHQKFPLATVDWVVERRSAQIVKAHPLVRKAIVFDTRSWKKALFSKKTYLEIKEFLNSLREDTYHYVLDLQGNTKSGCIDWFVKSDCKVGYAKSCVREKLNLMFTNKKISLDKNLNAYQFYGQFGKKAFDDPSAFEVGEQILSLSKEEVGRLDQLKQTVLQKNKPSIMFVLGSTWENKKLSEATIVEFFKKIANKVDIHAVFVYGSMIERDVVASISQNISQDSTVVGELTLPLWQALMMQMEGVVSVDTSGLHLAALAGVPTLAFFGPSSSQIYNPLGVKHQSIQGKCPYGIHFQRRCPKLRVCSSGACLKSLPVKDLEEKFLSFFQNLNHSLKESKI